MTFKHLPLKLIFAACLVFIGICASQAAEKEKGSIKFESTSYDFGMINESGGPVTHEFVFTNTGKGNLVIHSAKAECGCTTPEYPEQPIAPGKSGKIKVTYNPLGRPGGFTKVVTVRTNGSPSKVTLKIRGTVKPSSVTLDNLYPYGDNILRLDAKTVIAGKIPLGKSRKRSLTIYNASDDTICVALSGDSDKIKLEQENLRMAPGEKAIADFIVYAPADDNFGRKEYHINLKQGKEGDKTGSNHVVTVVAEAVSAHAL